MAITHTEADTFVKQRRKKILWKQHLYRQWELVKTSLVLWWCYTNKFKHDKFEVNRVRDRDSLHSAHCTIKHINRNHCFNIANLKIFPGLNSSFSFLFLSFYPHHTHTKTSITLCVICTLEHTQTYASRTT